MLSRINFGDYRLPSSSTFLSSPRLHNRFTNVLLLIWLLLWSGSACSGYSLLSHEEVVDILWQEQIQPLLLQRYPGADTNALRQAHAYAYGGCLIHDLGYYPFGSKFFSELTHYVRSGDFIANLLSESTDLDEYAFALGALAHYSSDRSGHPLINHAVALVFPKLRARYGETVTYEQNPKAHIQTEFGFDITQVAKKRYTSDRYHDFIGFAVSKPVLERAFYRTYGLRLEDVLFHVDLAIGTFRRAISRVIPEMTRAALAAYHPELVQEIPNFNEKQFLYNLSRAQYDREWGREYRKPGVVGRVLGVMVAWVPKVGLFKALGFKLPTPQTEDLYIQSVNKTIEDYRALLRQVSAGNLDFADLDCDTGRATVPGEYTLTDATYARLLEMLIKQGLEGVTPDLRSNILAFYAKSYRPGIRQGKSWRRTAEEVAALKAGPDSLVTAQVRKRLLAPPFKLQSPKARDA